jgi:hypothetical protein
VDASPSQLENTMPKKLFPSEPARIFNALLAETEERLQALVDLDSFTVHTDDPAYTPFADTLIEEHFPPQTELPLT